jgi:hypothetical protein
VFICSSGLSTENEDVVTLERFSAILEWFGPFAKGKKLLQNVVSTIKIKYFARRSVFLLAVLHLTAAARCDLPP